MRLPNPTTSEVRWSFVVAFLCAAVLTGTISWGVVHKVNQSDQIVRIAASSADQVERLNAQLDAQAKASQAQRDELMQQNRLTRTQLRALLRYLRAHGIQVPQTALTPAPKRLPAEPEPGTTTRPKASGPTGTPAAPTGPVADPAPGKSGVHSSPKSHGKPRSHRAVV